MTVSANVPGSQRDFSLVLGGPLFQLLRRAHLSGDALTLARKRVLVISLFLWLPLLVLSAAEGKALKGSVLVPFLMDLEQHIRFLVAVPLLIIAELVVHQRMRPVVSLFLERKLIPENARSKFEAAVESAYRLRNSALAELGLIAFVYVVGIQIVWREYLALHTATWYATPGADGNVLSIAGIWYGYVSLPLSQFLLLRWYFRIFIWARFLWQASKIELSLVPSHPDRLGGLGFLGGTIFAFAPLAAAHGALAAGPLANRIFYLGARLPEFKGEVVGLVLIVLFLVFAPLLVFAPQLGAARRRGTREYATLAQHYVRDFESKWLRGGAPEGEALLGSADIQSLADLGNSFEIVRTMNVTPITKEAIVRLTMATLAPLVPLLLTMMPLEELLKKMLGLLF
ncbi:MAG TPA: hypothetical protein VFK05_13815 [Polyangiaceae bacterium]|nr:hypothetical protein [Polyangiaceae bacterium]